MLPSVSGPTSAGPAAYAVPPPRRGVADELVWETLAFATPPGYRPLFLDLHVPRPRQDGARPPLVLWVHGGGWETGSRRRFPVAFERHWFLERVLVAGFAVASVDYRLVREAPFPSPVVDVRGALRWLVDHADDFGYDARRPVLWGESAGAHLALLAAAGETADGTTAVAAVVDWYGPTDLPAMAQAGTSTEEQGGEPSGDESLLLALQAGGWDVAAASPVAMLDAAAPPVFIAHGRDDVTVPLSQSRLLHERLTALGVPVELHETDGGHVFEGSESLPHVLALSLDFLGRTLGTNPGPLPAVESTGFAGPDSAPVPAPRGTDAAITGDDGVTLPVRVHRPTRPADTVVVHLDSRRGPERADPEGLAVRISAAVPATVVRVGSGNEDRDPARALAHALTATSWVHEHWAAQGAGRVVLVGEGPDAALALAVAARCRDAGIPVDGVLADAPTAQPGLQGENLSGLCPVVLGVGALDPGFEASLALVHRLRSLGVPTRLRIFPSLEESAFGSATRSAPGHRAAEQLLRDLAQLLDDGRLR